MLIEIPFSVCVFTFNSKIYLTLAHLLMYPLAPARSAAPYRCRICEGFSVCNTGLPVAEYVSSVLIKFKNQLFHVLIPASCKHLIPFIVMANQQHPAAIDNGLPNDPSGLVFKGASHSLPPNLALYVSLEDLEADEKVITKFKVLVAAIVYYKRSKTGPKDRSLYSRVSQEKKEGQNFDRTMVLMCLNSSAGRNTAIVTLNGHKSDVMFGQFLVGRDAQDGFGPGALVAIRAPEMISNYFGDQHGLPVLQFSGGMKLIDVAKSKVKICFTPSSTAVLRLQAFFYPSVKLELNNLDVGQTTCCGVLCDSIDMKNPDGTWRDSCPCFTTSKGLGYGVLDLSLQVRPEGNIADSFEVSHFTSRTFTGMVTKEGIPSSINQMQLERTGADFVIMQKMDALLSFVNANGGFRVLGWIRLGRSMDQASSDAAPGASKTSIISSKMIHHITRVELNCKPELIKEHLIDIQQILNACQGGGSVAAGAQPGVEGA